MSRSAPGSSDASSSPFVLVTAALGRLDAYSFWVVPTPPKAAGDLIVVGSTGAFVVQVSSLGGRLRYARGSASVDGVAIKGLRQLKRSAKRTTSTLSEGSVYVEAEPIVCLTEAIAGAATTINGVCILHLRDLVPHISGRPRVLEQGRAQRGARALGMHLAGDRSRHFTVG
ncbi:MAG: hypothetical protein ABI572_03600 [Actinomycetota bacterium]